MTWLDVALEYVDIDIPGIRIVRCKDPTKRPSSIFVRRALPQKHGRLGPKDFVTQTFNPEARSATASCDIDLDKLFGSPDHWEAVGDVLLSQFAQDIAEAIEAENKRYYVRKVVTLSSLTFTLKEGDNRMTGAVLNYWIFVGKQRGA